MPKLADPLVVKGLPLRSRLVMAPMVTGLAVDHRPSEAQLAWYTEHARAGLGLVIVESAAIALDGKLLPFMLGIWSDDQIEGLTPLAQAIQREGVPAILQIVHGGARSWREDPLEPRLGPSPVALLPGPVPKEMNETDIARMIQAFVAAARRAKAAGFDGVELHAAHYYLLSQFLSPRSNHRTDAWGGSLEHRARLLLEIVRAVRAEVGPDYPIFCRMHAVEILEGGLSTEDSIQVARWLEAAGVDVLDASGVGTSSMGEWEGQPYLSTSSVLPKDAEPGTFAIPTGRLRAALRIPVIAVGKLGAPGAAQRVLDAGQADLVALARQLIADPQTAQKLLNGQEADINHCRECLACFSAIRKGPIRCTVNSEIASAR